MTGILLAIGWALSAVLSYWALRHQFINDGLSWTMRDRWIAIMLSGFGPLNYIWLVIFGVERILHKASIDWDRPARW